MIVFPACLLRQMFPLTCVIAINALRKVWSCMRSWSSPIICQKLYVCNYTKHKINTWQYISDLLETWYSLPFRTRFWAYLWGYLLQRREVQCICWWQAMHCTSSMCFCLLYMKIGMLLMVTGNNGLRSLPKHFRINLMSLSSTSWSFITFPWTNDDKQCWTTLAWVPDTDQHWVLILPAVLPTVTSEPWVTGVASLAAFVATPTDSPVVPAKQGAMLEIFTSPQKGDKERSNSVPDLVNKFILSPSSPLVTSLPTDLLLIKCLLSLTWVSLAGNTAAGFPGCAAFPVACGFCRLYSSWDTKNIFIFFLKTISHQKNLWLWKLYPVQCDAPLTPLSRPVSS